MSTKPQNGLASRNTSAAGMPADKDDSLDALPPLFRDRAFLGMTATQFFGAFNDNLFKQLMLLLAVPVASCIKTFFDAWRPQQPEQLSPAGE